jgi:hypothetical protein
MPYSRAARHTITTDLNQICAPQMSFGVRAELRGT